MNVKAKLPTAVQAGIRPEIYGKLAQNPQCARLGTECQTPCENVDSNGEYPVELDHIVPKSRGGLNSIDNLQWLCACKNREKHSKPDVQYSGDLYFDQPIDIEKLRPHQVALGYKLAVQDYKDLFIAPEKLLARYMLLAWLVGAGKTVGVMSILFGINHVRKSLGGGSARRIKRVLWLVHQKSLVSSIARELETELTEHKIAEYNPAVVKVTDSAKWDYRADIVVACPQALWDSKVNSLDDTRRAEILSSFDAIVVDEAHFGMDHYLHLSKLAPLAFKFAVTSTPMDGSGTLFCDIDNGEYKNHFALYSAFGYTEGREFGIYKELMPYTEGAKQGFYVAENGGESLVMRGAQTLEDHNTDISNNLIRDIGLIKRAVLQAEAIDQHNNYDTHVMVRTSSIAHAQSLVKYLDHTGQVFGVWAGSKGPLLGDDKSPWMRAKANKGRIPNDGKRVVVTVDIGQFGINNRYCGIIVWVDPNKSMVEIVQRVGRAIRLGPGQSDSQVRLFWNGAYSYFSSHLDQALEFILNLPERMTAFQSMHDLTGDLEPITLSSVAAPLKPEHRVAIAAKMGEGIIDGVPVADTVISAVSDLSEMHGWSADYTDKALRFAESLVTKDGKDKALHLPQSVTQGSPLVLKEEPINDYSPERLASAVYTGLLKPRLDSILKEKLIDRILEGDELTLADVTSELMDKDRAARKLDEIATYSPRDIAGGIGSKEKPPFPTFSQMLREKYNSHFLDYRKINQAIARAVNLSIADHFGLPNFRKDTYQAFEKQLSDAMTRENERRMIHSRSEVYLLRDNQDQLPGICELFREQVDYAMSIHKARKDG